MADDKAKAAAAPKDDRPDDVKAAQEQAAKDREWQAEHPNEPLIRGANKDVGGE